MTTTPMKRAGQLIAHLETLHQIRDVRQLLLLQLSMRERQDQVALFKRQGETVTLSLIGAQLAAPTETLSHRAGTVAAGVLLSQLQAASGITGDDVAFSAGQIGGIVDAETGRIEASDGLARLDAALLGLVGRLEQEASEAVPAAPQDPAEAPAQEASAALEGAGREAQDEPAEDENIGLPAESPDESEGLVADLPAGRARRRA